MNKHSGLVLVIIDSYSSSVIRNTMLIHLIFCNAKSALSQYSEMLMLRVKNECYVVLDIICVVFATYGFLKNE